MSKAKIAIVLCSIGFFILGAIVALGCEHLFFKQSDARDGMQTIAVMKDWRLTCPPRTEKDGTCLLQQAIVQQSTSDVLAQLTISQKGQDDTLAIVTPLGVLIPPGLHFSVGQGQPRAIAFTTCVQGGCVATLPLGSDLSAALASNAGGRIVVVSGAGKPVTLNYSLQGFPDAIAARAADMKARMER